MSPKIIKYIIAEVFVVFFLLILLPSVLIKKSTGQSIEGGKPILSLQKGKTYSQVIENPTHSLNSISLQLKNPMIKDNSLILVQIFNSQGELLKEFNFYGSNVGDPSWVELNFPPLSDPNPILQISADCLTDNSLYLYIGSNDLFDIKTTYALPSFKNRLFQNINYQLNQFSKRSLWHNIFYFTILISLNLYLIKLINENYKKQ